MQNRLEIIMLQKVREFGAKEIARITVLVLLSIRMFCHLFYIMEQEFDVFRYRELYLSMIYLCVIVAIYRGIKIKDYLAWIYLALGAVVLWMVFRVRDITAETYGQDYFKVILLQGILWVLFAGLMLDLIRHKPYGVKSYLRNPVIILYVFFTLIFFITNRDSVIPYICPVYAVILTSFSEKDRRELTYLASVGSYFAFVKCFTTSLIQNPDVYEGGRYYGSFFNIGSAGCCCAVALISCIYLFFVFKDKKNKAGMLGSLLFTLYPAAAILMMGSRTVELGVFLAIASIPVFLHGKGMKTTYIRFGIALAVVIMIPVGLFFASKILFSLTENGIIDASRLNYFWEHVLRMTTSKGKVEDCIFIPGTFMYSLDVLASTRFSIYAEKIGRIRFSGFNEYARIGYNSHNFFIANLVRYGILGGLPFLAWFLACIFSFAKKVKEKRYMIFSILLFLLMLGNYSTQSLYINCMGGCLLLITQVFAIDEGEKPKVEDCEDAVI